MASYEYETAARAVKVLKLVEVVMQIAHWCEVDPAGPNFADALKEQTPAWWARVAEEVAEVPPPSETTKALVLAHFRALSEIDRDEDRPIPCLRCQRVYESGWLDDQQLCEECSNEGELSAAEEIGERL